MKSWILRLFAPTAPRPPAMAAPLMAARTSGPSAPAPPDSAHIELGFFAWLLDSTALAAAPLGARELQTLAHLDRLVADTDAHKRLLPRAAAVVPQLLARLRGETGSLTALTELVSRDVVLVAEVIRMANSAHYRRQDAVVGLLHAVRVLGVEGLRRAIARAVMQPLIDVRGSEFIGRCAQRLWQHSDHKAQLCAALARCHGHDAFEGYLLGLVHNAAWSAVLRAMDGVRHDSPWQIGRAFFTDLTLRRDRLFAVIAQQWQLSDEFLRVAHSVAQQGLIDTVSPQGEVLRRGDLLASLLCQRYDAEAAGPLLSECAEPVRECYLALAGAAAAQPGRCSPAAAHTTRSTQMARM